MPTTQDIADDDVIELEPTMTLEAIDGRPGASPISPGPAARLASPDATSGSFTNKTEALRRTRLLAAAVCLAAVYTLLVAWVFLSDHPGTLCSLGTDFSPRMVLLGLHGLIAAAVAGLLASEAPLSRRQLRAVEYTLFLGLTLVSMASLYFVGLDLMRRGPESAPVILAFVKNGLIQMLILMMIYGMLIPNPPAIAARTLSLMFLGPVAVGVALRMHPEVAPVLERLGEAEEAGSNFLFLGMGTALAIYGAYLVNGIRTQLHEALKFGQYKLVRSLGAGGMGEVYLAEHALLKRPCALKLIRPDAGADPLALARFEREVQSSARLAHHNTIEIYDYGHTEDGTFYYVMEYLRGLSLGDLVKQAGPLPAGRVIYLFRQICAGLAEAHGLGLIHRDLKPANVFVAVLGGEADVAKVLDFGLVKVTKEPEATSLTAEMTVSGTPHYMAPEQAAASRDLDARADVYALGAMLYYALTGQPPFHGENAFAVMMAHARDPITRPSEVRPGIPGDLEDVVLRALAKNPADRFSGVRELSDALAACASASEWGPRQADEWWASNGAIDPA
jgi:serine/threonine-protein kinase